MPAPASVLSDDRQVRKTRQARELSEKYRSAVKQVLDLETGLGEFASRRLKLLERIALIFPATPEFRTHLHEVCLCDAAARCREEVLALARGRVESLAAEIRAAQPSAS